MYVAATMTCAAAFASFAWGVLRFFRRSSAPTALTRVTAVAGLFFGAWHILAIAGASSTPGRIAAGIAAHTVAMALFWSAIHACRTRPLTAIFEPDVPARLVEEGVYRYMRHPFYTAYSIFWFGGWMATESRIALLSVVVMMLIYVRGARAEERKFARSPLAEPYAAYRRRVGAWSPRIKQK
jgi:protein-S-isoprenylcysteine O-methyltransferase Ste14